MMDTSLSLALYTDFVFVIGLMSPIYSIRLSAFLSKLLIIAILSKNYNFPIVLSCILTVLCFSLLFY